MFEFQQLLVPLINFLQVLVILNPQLLEINLVQYLTIFRN